MDGGRDGLDEGAIPPRVSVVLIFLNGERFLGEAIDSVLAQTWRDFELILVDDGSKAAATAIARGYADRHPACVRYLEHDGHANLGMSASRNAGFAVARGELIALIDADDAWLPGKLADQVALADRFPTVGMIAGGAIYWKSWEGGTDQEIVPGNRLDEPVPPPEALLGTYPLGPDEAPCPSTFLCRKTALDAIGGFEESYRGMYEDQAFLAKMYLAFPVLFPNRSWLMYRQHDDSCSSETALLGRMDKVRTTHFRWLTGYMRDRGVTDARVWAALHRVQRRHRRAVMFRLLNPHRWHPAIRHPIRRIKRGFTGRRTPRPQPTS